MNNTHKHIIRGAWRIIALLVIVFQACNPTKYVPEGEYLLDEYHIKIDETKGLQKKDIESCIRQKPNKRIIGFRFHLGLYNLSNKNKNTGFQNWLRKIGEEPAIYSSIQTKKTADQISLYAKNKGYYNSQITDSVKFKGQKAIVTYTIVENKPYKIRNIAYNIEDTLLAPVIFQDTINSVVKRAENFDMENLQLERERIEYNLKSKGYYRFSSRDMIFIEADTALKSRLVDITYIIKMQKAIKDDKDTVQNHKKYRINNIYIYTNYNAQKSLIKDKYYYNTLDTIMHDSIYFIIPKKINVSPGILSHSVYIERNKLYNLYNVERTQQHLSSLRLFKFINIQFTELKDTTKELGEKMLNCYIHLSPLPKQSFTFELEGSNSSGNMGVAGNLIYNHKNLFNSAENFDYKIRGAIEAASDDRLDNKIEFGNEARIYIPRFLLPFRSEQFIKKYNPKTTISGSFNYQKRPDYTRGIINTSFGYLWKGNRYLTHGLNPIEVNIIDSDVDPDYYNSLSRNEQQSFNVQFISAANYYFVFNNQKLKKNTNFWFCRLFVETAGNTLRLVNDNPDSIRVVNRTYEFAKYVKSDIDLRYSKAINPTDNVVYRIFMGVGHPYMQTSLPWEKKYFSGGANSIRAWGAMDLGPGSYKEVDSLKNSHDKKADIKLEANMEYRFDLFWILQGALFLDAGNIWSAKNDNRPGALFSLVENTETGDLPFYREIAVGTGFGLRFDFSFFICRLDIGMKLRDPEGFVTQGGNKKYWLINNSPSGDYKYFSYNFAIGYPF